jgi:hypothetical protein
MKNTMVFESKRVGFFPRVFTQKQLNRMWWDNIFVVHSVPHLKELKENESYILQPLVTKPKLKVIPAKPVEKVMVFSMTDYEFMGVIFLTQSQWLQGKLLIDVQFGNVA